MKEDNRNNERTQKSSLEALRLEDDKLELVSGGSLDEVVIEDTKDIDDGTANRIWKNYLLSRHYTRERN